MTEKEEKIAQETLYRLMKGYFRYARSNTIASLSERSILIIVDTFKQVGTEFSKDSEKEQLLDKSVSQPISDSNNQEIGETETSPNLGGDAAIERCPTEGFD